MPIDDPCCSFIPQELEFAEIFTQIFLANAGITVPRQGS